MTELTFKVGQLRAQLTRQHVAAAAHATLANRLVEIELAVLQLAGLGQTRAECVQPVGLCLQFGQACGQCVDLMLGIAAHLLQLDLATGVGGLHRLNLGHAGGAAHSRTGHHANGQQHAGSGQRMLHRPESQPIPQRANLDECARLGRGGMVLLGCFGHRIMSRSRSTPRSLSLDKEAKLPAGPRAALDALFAGGAGDPLRRAMWLDAMDQLLRPCLPPSLAAHARLANVRGDKLVYVVDAPVWHAKLRLTAPELLNAARSIGLNVAVLQVKTTLQPLRPLPPAAHSAPPMSAATRSGLATALALLRSDALDESAPGAGEDR